MRRILLILLIVLGASAALGGCAVPAAPLPTASPAPTIPNLPTLAPVGPTILRSDINTPRATPNATEQAAVPTVPPQGSPPPASSTLQATPSAEDFAFALRPQFAQDLSRIANESVYTLNWTLNDDLSEIQGSQRVIFANRTGKPLNEIYFRLFANYPGGEGNIQIHNVRVNRVPVETQLEENNTALRLLPARPIGDGPTIINLDYTIEIPRDNTIRYADFTRASWITTLPTVYPIIPAYDADGWHTELPPPYGDLVYADSSIYDVTITTPSRYTVIASGEMIRETNSGAQTTRRFIGAPMRDFDVNISDQLQKSSAQVDDVTIHSWYLASDADAGRRALEWTVNAFRVYEKRFGAYPFKELDLVETPTTAGGIEYPGVITVASNLYRDPGQTNFFEFATVHETAHQWFYSTVGNDQVNHPWLDESLTQYASLIYFEERYGKETARNIRQNYFDQQYEKAMQRYGDKPAGLPVGAYDEDAYGAFVYAKGPKFFQAVRDFLGDDLFFHGLQDYYAQFKYRIAQPRDLVNAFNQASGRDITPLFLKWIGG